MVLERSAVHGQIPGAAGQNELMHSIILGKVDDFSVIWLWSLRT